MLKKSKGFSLIELLVVVAIIAVIAGVGLVNYQQYVESAKKRVAQANWNNVLEYLKIETVVLNNQILRESPTVKVGNALWESGTHTLDQYINGAAAYHDLGTGLANFKNPYNNTDSRQVYSASNNDDINDSGYQKKGSIVLRIHPDYSTDGSKINGERNFQVLYYSDDNVEDVSRTVNFKFQ